MTLILRESIGRSSTLLDVRLEQGVENTSY